MQQVWDWIKDVLLGTGGAVKWTALVVALFMLLEGAPLRGLLHRGYNLLVFALNMIGLAVVGLALDRVEAAMPEHGLIGRLLPGWTPGHPGSWQNVLWATLLYTVVYDFFHYWAHRAQHEFAPLWVLHRVHHNDNNMDASTSVRHSLGAGVVGMVLAHFPTYLILGGGMLPYFGAIILFWVWFFFTHAQLRWSMGWLTAVLVGPQMHRIHHGRSVAYHNRNYAQFFPFYDWLFGTLRMPEQDEWPETGVDGDDQPRWAWQQVFLPWLHPVTPAALPEPVAPAVEVADDSDPAAPTMAGR